MTLLGGHTESDDKEFFYHQQEAQTAGNAENPSRKITVQIPMEFYMSNNDLYFITLDGIANGQMMLILLENHVSSTSRAKSYNDVCSV